MDRSWDARFWEGRGPSKASTAAAAFSSIFAGARARAGRGFSFGSSYGGKFGLAGGDGLPRRGLPRACAAPRA